MALDPGTIVTIASTAISAGEKLFGGGNKPCEGGRHSGRAALVAAGNFTWVAGWSDFLAKAGGDVQAANVLAAAYVATNPCVEGQAAYEYLKSRGFSSKPAPSREENIKREKEQEQTKPQPSAPSGDPGRAPTSGGRNGSSPLVSGKTIGWIVGGLIAVPAILAISWIVASALKGK